MSCEPVPSAPAAWLRRLWSMPHLLLAFTALCWSGNFIVGRAVHMSVPPVALAFWRWSGAFLLVIGFALPHLRRDWPRLMRHWRRLLVLSALGVAAFNTGVYLGLQTTTALNALLLQSAMPVLILLASFALFRERTGPVQLGGVALSLAGVAVIVGQGAPAAPAGLALNPGDAWVLAAVAAYAVYSALLRRRPDVHPLSFLAATFALGSLMLLPFHLAEHLGGRPAALDAPTLLAIGYVALFPSVLAYACWNRGVELIGANRAGPFVHLMPAFGSVLAVLLLGEAFRLFHALGIALIGAGILLAARRR
jgi:drug/metabolite transporter (DMT)-like permease